MKKLIVVLFAAFFTAACGEEMNKVQEAPVTVGTPVKEPVIEQFELGNGLKVFMVVDRTAPLVAVDVNYHVGSKNEKPGSTGFAHLFEHMMFQGSQHYDDDYFKPLQDVGGQVNGATSTDRTRYWEIVPSPYLERALWLESDRMGYLLPAMTQERLDNQKSVVQNERRQNYDNRPYGTAWEKMAAAMYPPSHPYSWLTIGSMKDIGAATLEDVSDFFKTWYTPNNASIAIVGDIDLERTRALVTKYFGAIPPGPALSSVGRWQPVLTNDIVLELTDRAQLPRNWISWPTVPAFDADEAALDAFGQILGGGRTSRLYMELIYRRQIAQDAIAGQRSSQIAGVFDIVLTPRPGVDPIDLENAALDVLDEMLANGVTQEELDRVKTQLTSEFVRGMENIGGFGGLADRINSYQHFLGRPDGFRADLQRYLDLTVNDLTLAGRKYLKGARITARVTPAGQLMAAASDLADRTTLPGRGADSHFDLPDRKSFELDNGLKVVVVTQDRLPLVGMALVVPGGSAADPSDRLGLASLLADLLSEGAGERDATAFAKAVEATGGLLEAGVDSDSWYVSASVLKSSLPAMFGLVNDMITRPMLPGEELERQRAERLTRLTQSLDMPMYNAFVAAIRTIFGGHPYGHPQLGTTADVKAITIEDVRGLYDKWFSPADSVLIVVGDITPDETKAMLTGTLDAWKPIPGLPPRVAKPDRLPPAFTVVDMPGAEQSVVMVAAPGPVRATRDIAAIDVLNTAEGGSFVSRLNLNLREDKGYTYGARTNFDMKLAGGMVYATAQVKNDVTGATIGEMLRELVEVGTTRPLTPEELRYARDSIINGYAGRFATIDKIASELIDTYVHNLPPDAVETYPSEVAGVSVEDVTSIAARWFAADALSIIVAGDAAKIMPQLSGLGIDMPVKVVDREGRPRN